MTINALSLPVDIPWKRRCVSKDMMDSVICDDDFPLKWRSSIAIFTYEPPETEQTLSESLITYVKVSCTITGHQRNPRSDLTLPNKLSGFESAEVTNAFETAVGKYYACYGALLQLSVGASHPESIFAISRGQAYIADFEPKKRELYELVTETGETMSRSLETVNVGKSNVSSQSSEVVDGSAISLQLSQSAGDKQANQTETTQTANFEATSQKTNVGSSQVEDNRASDQSRENRETNSHTTQLTQMYHQITGYHVGTNRALFFMLPRPHIVQSAQTFVKGPRQLEGIQEFFLVVVRPKDWADFCIDAYLETAHITEQEMVPVTRHVPWTTKRVVAGTETAPDRDGMVSLGDDSYEGPAISDVDSFPMPAGCTIKSAVQINQDVHRGSVTELKNDADGLVVQLSAKAYFKDDQSLFGGSNYSDPGWAQATYDIELITPDMRPSDAPQRLFLTGRRVCCCNEGLFSAIRDFISYEAPLGNSKFSYRPTHVAAGRMARDPTPRFAGDAPGLSILEANALRDQVGREMMASVNSARRLPAGLIGLDESEYVAEIVARRLKRADETVAADLSGLPKPLRVKLRRAGEGLRRVHLLRMSPQEQRERFGLDDEELVALRRAAIGLVPSDEAPSVVWDRRRFGDAAVPDVLHLDLETAHTRLKLAGIPLGRLTYVDSLACRGTILKQSPGPGPMRLGIDAVDLEAASGACVLVPEVAGLSIAAAIQRLQAAGLQASPTFAPERGRLDAPVKRIRPGAGSWVTPQAEILLTLG